MIIKAGTVLDLVTGDYSDTQHHGPFRVLKDFDQCEVTDLCRDDWNLTPRGYWDDGGPSPQEFIAYLSGHGYIEDIHGAVEWHIGGYNDLVPMIDGKRFEKRREHGGWD